MTEKEAYIHEWIKQVSSPKDKLGGFAVCPYASGSKTLIVDQLLALKNTVCKKILHKLQHIYNAC